MDKPNPVTQTTTQAKGSTDDISAQYETPDPEPIISFTALKDRIRHHYDICSDYYYSLWCHSFPSTLPQSASSAKKSQG